MPFTKTSGGKYKSPSGRTFNEAQVRLYYAGGGKFPGQKADPEEAAEGKADNPAEDRAETKKKGKPGRGIDYYGGMKAAMR